MAAQLEPVTKLCICMAGVHATAGIRRAWGRWRGVPVERYGAAYGACLDGWG